MTAGTRQEPIQMPLFRTKKASPYFTAVDESCMVESSRKVSVDRPQLFCNAKVSMYWFTHCHKKFVVGN